MNELKPKTDETTELRREMEKGFRLIKNQLKEVSTRLNALEEHLGNRISPPGKRVSPAIEETMVAIERLTGLDSWASLREISKETKRSLPTEATYLKYLYENGIAVRKPSYSNSTSGRRVRTLVYRLK
jgi:stress response protein YsnF